VVLVQACQDARRAYRNWFDSRSGKRHGRRVGHPRFRTKHGRQSIRLTRNGFALHGTRLYVAKVGNLRVRWSRSLPSVPSSVSVICEADGRYYASFVVRRGPARLPPVARTAGIDLGLARFAVVAASDGTAEVVANPRHLRAAEQRLARAQRALSRKQKGSANRAKARVRVAVAKLALRPIPENQRDRGRGPAAQHGRQVIKISRWEPPPRPARGAATGMAPSRSVGVPGSARCVG
jgi:putative transposase